MMQNGQSSESREFLGTGIAFEQVTDSERRITVKTMNVDANGLIAMNSLEQHVRQSILLILKTAKGERVMRPDFGAGLRELAFEPLNQATMTLAEHHVREALIRFEPRIEVLKVTALLDPQEKDRVGIHLQYRVRSTDTTFNLVYPFYVERGGL
jgi:phage baseplate assembly protein W